MRTPSVELDDLASRSTAPLLAVFSRLASSLVDDDRRAYARASAALIDLLGHALILSDLYGRRRVLLELDAAGASFKDEVSPLVPRVEFEQAIRDVLSREPRLAANADEVSAIYRTRHALAVARATEIEVTKRVQAAIAEIARAGDGTVRAEKVVAAIGGWATAYAETVYRTNLATAYQAGRFQQAFDKRVAPEMRAFEYQTAGDADVRDGTNGPENHAAADGLIAGTRDSVWHRASPPCGYNCRCSLRLVGVTELEDLGLLRDDGTVIRREPPGFSQFVPHPRFGHTRPDLVVYGS